MRRRIAWMVTAAGLAVGAAFAAAPNAQAAGQFCYDVDVVVNGDPVVDEDDCIVVEAPPGPELPEPPAS